MAKLSKVLKDIYTSDNKVTVLQLLDKLIKAVETYEMHLPLYRHSITCVSTEGSIPFAVATTIYSGQPTFTEAELREAVKDATGWSATGADTTLFYSCYGVTFTYAAQTQKFTPKMKILKSDGPHNVSGSNDGYVIDDEVVQVTYTEEDE